MKLSPIIVSVYNRKQHLEKCIDSLKANKLAKDSTIFIVSDGAAIPEHQETILQIRKYISNIQGFSEVIPIFRETNYGSNKSVYDAFDFVLSQFDSFIFLEDDIEVAPTFLEFMNNGLETYHNRQDILSICSYSLPIKIPFYYKKDIYLGKRFSPWGFAIWKDKFNSMNMQEIDRYDVIINDKNKLKQFKSVGNDILTILKDDSECKIQAADVRICYHQILNKMYCVFPIKSLSKNNGMDGTGEHCGISDRFDVKINSTNDYQINMPIKIKPSKDILHRFRNYQNNTNFCKSFLCKIKYYFLSLSKNILKKIHLYNKLKKIFRGING